jgi:hypothetical protein
MRKGFILYRDQKQMFDLLSDEQAGKLIKHIFAYMNDLKDANEPDAVVNFAFQTIKTAIQRDADKYEKKCEKSRESGRLGAENRWQKKQNMANNSERHTSVANDSERHNTIAKIANKDKEKEKDNNKEKEKEKDIISAGAAINTPTPPAEIFLNECLERGYREKIIRVSGIAPDDYGLYEQAVKEIVSKYDIQDKFSNTETGKLRFYLTSDLPEKIAQIKQRDAGKIKFGKRTR